MEIMVCAPNWRNICTKPFGDKFIMFIGTCYSSSGVEGPFGNFTPVLYYNTQTPPHYYMKDGFCQAGFSVAFTEEVGGLVMGAPGCHSWAGDVFWANVDDVGSLKRHGKTYEQSQLVQGSTSSKSLTIKDRYMGYAVAEGTFGERRMVVSSAPKEGVFDNGNVFSDAAIYILEQDGSKPLNIWASLFISNEDAWKFAYCGFSLAVVDFDLDGLDDVAVGCPYYGEDRGAFVIFFQRKTGGTYVMKKEEINFPNIQVNNKPESPRARVGEIKDRFGSAIAGIGDIDGDGFTEFAVGAPGVEIGQGRVYIFRGEQGGLSIEPCQVLDATADQKNFGWALASGADLLTVGMASPAEVVVYRPRRVLLPELRLRADVRLPVVEVRAVPVQVCLRYSVRGNAPDSAKRRFEASLVLDVGKDSARLQFADGMTGRTRSFVIEGAAGNEVCVSFDVKKKAKEDGITSYKLQANATLQASELADAVVDPLQVMSHTATLEPELLCDDSECVTEVAVSMQHDGAYTYAPEGKLFLIVHVTVSRDPAYFVVLNFDTHGMLSYSAVQGQAGLQCEGGTQFSCKSDILQDTQVKLNITLLPSQVMQESITEHSPAFNIAASLVSSTNFSAASRPNASLAVPVVLDLDFGVTGDLDPKTVYMATNEDVTVTFSLKNSNKYAYGVSFVVAPKDEAADCVSNILLVNNTCSEHNETNNLKIRCDYESFSGQSEKVVEVSTKVHFKEGCGAPLEGTATFSKLPFSLTAPSEASSPSVDFRDDQAWYKIWWVWLLIGLGVLLVVLNVVIVVVYCVKKKQPGKNQAQTDARGAGDAKATRRQDSTADAQGDEDVNKALKS